MGQIIGRSAKPDACNIRSLSSFGTPAAGQHILVSTDNSAMQNGQGNFDAYVVGNGTTAATELELHNISDEKAKLDALLGEEEIVIDFSDYQVLEGSFYQGKWYLSGTGTNTHIYVPVIAGRTYYIRANKNYPTEYAFVTETETAVNNRVPKFCANCTDVKMAKATANNAIVAPPDSNYMIVIIKLSGQDRTPYAMGSKGVAGELDNIESQINDLSLLIQGGETSHDVAIEYTAALKYMNVNNGGAFATSSAYNIAFFPISKGAKVDIFVPLAANPAGYEIAYTDVTGDTLTNEQVIEFAGTVGVANNYYWQYTINDAADHKYLAVAYDPTYGLPEVKITEVVTAEVATQEDLKEITDQLEETIVEVAANTILTGYYVNKNYGSVTSGSSTSSLAFYPITAGKTYHISIPKTGSTATYVLCYSNKILADTEIVAKALSYIGDTQSFELDLVAEDYAYLIVDYSYASGVPTITTEQPSNYITRDEFEPVKENANERNELKILCFGNSFSQDSMGYVPMILKGLKPNANVTIGLGVIGGCTMAQHCANITGVAQTIGSTTYQPNVNYGYFEYNNITDRWDDYIYLKADGMISLRDWDIITFQMNGTNNYDDYATYYEPFLAPTFSALAGKVGKPIRIGWLLTHGSYCSTKADALTHWQGSAANTQRVMEETAADVLFPYGTAIQNLRTTSIATSGQYGSILQADNAHLQEGVATLCASYCMVLKILELLEEKKIGIIGEGTRPTYEWITEHNVPGTNYAEAGVVEGVTDANCYLAQVAAVKAISNPYEVTDLS